MELCRTPVQHVKPSSGSSICGAAIVLPKQLPLKAMMEEVAAVPESGALCLTKETYWDNSPHFFFFLTLHDFNTRNLWFEILDRLISRILEDENYNTEMSLVKKICVTEYRCTSCTSHHFCWWVDISRLNWKPPLVLYRDISFICEHWVMHKGN